MPLKNNIYATKEQHLCHAMGSISSAVCVAAFPANPYLCRKKENNAIKEQEQQQQHKEQLHYILNIMPLVKEH